MFRVLIVDDEQWSLYGMKRIVNWEELGFEICWEVSDAVEALEIIEEEEPDVVVSDIVMPELTGIEILNCAREKEIHSEFIFVSGFADFYYAQQAMEFGAFYYVLKPLKRIEFKNTILRLKKYLLDKQQSGLLKKEVERDEELMLLATNGKLFIDKLDIKTHYLYWQVMMLEGELIHGILPVEYLEQAHQIEIKLGMDKQIIIINSEIPVTDQWTTLLANYNGRVGLSSITTQVGKIPKIYKEAKVAFNTQFVNEGCKISIFEKRDYLLAKGVVDKLIDAIGYGTIQSESIWSDIEGTFRKQHLGVLEASFVYNELVIYLKTKYPEDELIQEMEFMDYEQLSTKFKNLVYMIDYFKEILSDNNKDKNTLNINQNFKELLEYVEQNYQKDLYLKELAEQFYLSSVYICKLFNQVLGVSFSKYVMNLRMNRACELLRDTSDTIAVIAEKVGYNDYFYFIKLFKKAMQLTPTAYRKLHS